MARKRMDQYTAEASKMTKNGAVKTGKKNTYVFTKNNVMRNPKGKLTARKGKGAGGNGG